MHNSQEVAARIKQLAKEQNVSIGELLSACGLGINTVSKMAKGNDILVHNLAQIADYLGCSVDYLLGRIDSPEATQPSSGIQQDSAISRMPAAGAYGMTSAEKELIRAYRRADSISQAMVLRALSIESPAAEKESGA